MCKKSLYEEVEHLWKADSTIADQVNEWLERLKKYEPILADAKKSFRKWAPLRFHTSITKADTDSKDMTAVELSVRFLGRQVGVLKIPRNKGEKAKLSIDKPKQSDTDSCIVDIPHKGKTVAWDSTEAKEFRNHFKKYASKKIPPSEIDTRKPEHKVESVLFQEMEKKRASDKFAGKFKGIQPIGIKGFPLQFAVPISASTGKPARSKGAGIDILARRRGSDGKVRLSVWELKKPKTLSKGIAQGYIYAICLVLMLRMKTAGEGWYRLFGFKRDMPEHLEIEVVIAVTKDREPELKKKLKELIDKDSGCIQTQLPDQSARIRFYAAYYNETTCQINDFEELACDHP